MMLMRIYIISGGNEMAKQAGPKLTAEQKRKVKSLIEDEGQTRAEAVAWVLAFEPDGAVATSGQSPVRCPCGTGECRECDDNGMVAA